jgi:hypothetical protein
MIIGAMKQALEFISSVKVHPTQIASRDALHDTLRTAIAEAEKQEPVAWRYKGNLHKFDPSDWASTEFPITPLYTTPPAAQREPLTEEQIMQTWEGIIKYAPGEVRLRDFARAIEAAHGITKGGEA